MITQVAVALVAQNGCYLVGRRGPDGPLAGYFEFPGGKCEPGESPANCAVRECLEETGLKVDVIRLRCDFQHTFPYGTVHLHFFDCRPLPETDSEKLDPRFGWVPRDDLGAYRFPEANESVVAELINSYS